MGQSTILCDASVFTHHLVLSRARDHLTDPSLAFIALAFRSFVSGHLVQAVPSLDTPLHLLGALHVCQ